jgi:ATP-dependent Clp protease ATP-binding subunit ClpA
MFERLDIRSRTVVAQARDEARLLGSGTLEAEHLLLALSRHSAWDAGTVLSAAGLDHDGLLRALEAELVRSLDAVGVAAGVIGVGQRPLPPEGQPRCGSSAKRALERSLAAAKARGDRTILPAHILLGTLGAEEGTVPRALAAVGVDPADLVASAGAALDRAA